MAHKTLINGTSYEISGGKTLVNDTAYSIDKGKTLVGGTAYEVGFGTPISKLPVGSSLYFKVNGVSTEFIIVHQGKPSNMYDDSCDGAWLLMKNCYVSKTGITPWNDNSYIDSNLNSYLNGDFPNLLEPNVLNSIIKQNVKIPYVYGNGFNGSVRTGSNGLSVKCFLLSAYEVGFTQSNNSALPIDGAVLDYFKTNASAKRDVNTNWWFRSPSMGQQENYNKMFFVGTPGGGLSVLFSSIEAAVRPAFILPSDFDITNYI